MPAHATLTEPNAPTWPGILRPPGPAVRPSRMWRLLWFLILPPDSHRTIPTPAGVVLILVTLGLGSAAYTNSSNILFMALSLLLSSLVLSGLLSWANFHGVRWILAAPPHFRAGEPAPLRLELRNTKKVIPTYSLLFRACNSHPGVAQPEAMQSLYLHDRLDPGAATALEWIFQPRRRGRQFIEIAGVESLFPFGFLRKIAGGRLQQEILVWPARLPYEFNPPASLRAHQSGETQRRPGTGADLLGLRAYRPGDAPRLIHWKASARVRHLLVRQTGEEQRSGYFILLEANRGLWPDAEQFERLCSVAASLAEGLFKAGQLRGVSLNGDAPLPIKRLADFHAWLDQLARFEGATKAAPIVLTGPEVITFQPVSRQQIHVFLGGQFAGAA